MDAVEGRPSLAPPTSSSVSASGSEKLPPRDMPSEHTATFLADRDPHEWFVQDLNEVLTWPDDRTRSIAKSIKDALCFMCPRQPSCSLRMRSPELSQTGTRSRWHEHYGMPASKFTKCPKLDTTLKSKLPKHCKHADCPLVKTQALPKTMESR